MKLGILKTWFLVLFRSNTSSRSKMWLKWRFSFFVKNGSNGFEAWSESRINQIRGTCRNRMSKNVCSPGNHKVQILAECWTVNPAKSYTYDIRNLWKILWNMPDNRGGVAVKRVRLKYSTCHSVVSIFFEVGSARLRNCSWCFDLCSSMIFNDLQWSSLIFNGHSILLHWD